MEGTDLRLVFLPMNNLRKADIQNEFGLQRYETDKSARR
jgi:hypothetical protein